MSAFAAASMACDSRDCFGETSAMDVTGTIKSEAVNLSVTVNVSGYPQTARFAGKVTSATKMTGTVTGTSNEPRKWSAEKKK
jgi:hypothetical protein